MNCPNCDGNGCEDCGGSGDVTGCVVCEDALPTEDSDRCARCAGGGDDEPYDIDDDRDFNPYTGAREDDGYDGGSDW